jgi:tetratricopeptide (TPR) repeat protein
LVKAMNEGRFQTALDIAKRMARADATAENRQRLIDCYLGRARQLRNQGSFGDAINVLNTGLEQAKNEPGNVIRFAEDFARCGEIRKSFSLIEWLPEPQPVNRVTTLAADAAIQRGPTVIEQLPEALRADGERIRQAFSHLTSGANDAVKEDIAGIGLSSPFLEWKVLLRGLTAYYEGNDERAIENWSRLDADRLPARLAAPFRFQCDPTFAAAQAPATQHALRRQAESLDGNPILAGLRRIQSALHNAEGWLNSVFREVEAVLPLVKAQRPDLVNRLARCLYWEIVDKGQPEDLTRYRRLFRPLPDDPDYKRMVALAVERGNNWHDAQEFWQAYEKEIAGFKFLSEAERNRARAMIWNRMGMNARKHRNLFDAVAHDLPDYVVGQMPRQFAPLDPAAEKCFEESIKLAPDWLDPRVSLVESFDETDREALARAAATELLKQFPDHLPTLDRLARWCREAGELEQAADYVERSLAHNPLSQNLRVELGVIRRRIGIAHAAQGRMDLARAALQSALELLKDQPHPVLNATWAACEFKAGNFAKAEEWLQQIAAVPGDAEILDGLMYGYALHLKLPKQIKARFEKPFKHRLDTLHPTPEQAEGLARLFSIWKIEAFSYYGSKSHFKKALAQIERTAYLPFTEAIIENTGMSLLQLDASRILQRLASSWERQFPKNPWPLYFEIESTLKGDITGWPIWRVKPLFDRCQKLAKKFAPEPSRERLLKLLAEREKALQVLNPMSPIFEQILDEFGGPFGDDAWEENDPW